MVAPTTAIGIGLFAILIEPKSTVVNCFPLSGREDVLTSKPGFTRTSASSYIRRYGISTRIILPGMSTNDDYIDAVVEEKTAGLALNEEENTSVSNEEE
jgi:hypothetical protein